MKRVMVPLLALPSRYKQEFIEGERLGKGGFGMVFRARNALDAVEYAIKKVRLTGSERAQERAVREATCLAKLDHPNVVRYYQVRVHAHVRVHVGVHVRVHVHVHARVHARVHVHMYVRVYPHEHEHA